MPSQTAYLYILQNINILPHKYFIGTCSDINKVIPTQFNTNKFSYVVTIRPYPSIEDANWCREVMWGDLLAGKSLYDFLPYEDVWFCTTLEAFDKFHNKETLS